MARTIRTKVYKFDELSKTAQANAVESYRKNNDYAAQGVCDNAQPTLDKFCKLFNINYRDIDYCEMYRSKYQCELDDQILELSGQRLATYIWNNYKNDLFKGKYYSTAGRYTYVNPNNPNDYKYEYKKRYSKCQLENSCVLTGMCYDDSVLQPIYDFLNKPRNIDFTDLLDECLHSLAKDVCSEIDYRYSDEAITETIMANGYEFTKDGNPFY